MREREKYAMTIPTVEHSADGTLVHDTVRGDREVNAALKVNGFRWSRNPEPKREVRDSTRPNSAEASASAAAARADQISVSLPFGQPRLCRACCTGIAACPIRPVQMVRLCTR